MAYHIRCSCGEAIEVTAGMSGTEVRCQCGRTNGVPALGELRRIAGQHAYVTNTVETINRMLARGELPPDQGCMVCYGPTDAIVESRVVCESAATRKVMVGGREPNPYSMFFEALCGPFGLAMRAARRGRTEKEKLGRDVTVHLPLRLCQACQQSHGGLRRSRVLKRLLCQVPVYKRLFEEYPRAKVTLVS